LGPLAIALIGTSFDREKNDITWDCWKPILHDNSIEPSSGIFLKDLLEDDRVKKIEIKDKINHLPSLVLTNKWDECFSIDYFYLPTLNKIAGHAKKLN